MPRTFLRQVTQIRNSDTYTDNLAAGIALETGAATIEEDLNSLPYDRVEKASIADQGAEETSSGQNQRNPCKVLVASFASRPKEAEFDAQKS